MRQLEQQRYRLGHRRTLQPARLEGHPAHDIVELVLAAEQFSAKSEDTCQERNQRTKDAP